MMNTAAAAHKKLQKPVAAATVLGAMPLPIVVIDEDLRFAYVNDQAEQFFAASAAVLVGQSITAHVPFGSPILALIVQVQETGASVNEYGVGLGTPRIGERSVDIQVSPVLEAPGSVLVLLQERTMAHKMDRQLTHRGAARSVTGMAGVLAHEIKNPLSGIRGAAQLMEMSAPEEDRHLTHLICEETDRICRLVDRMEIFADESPVPREPVNIHAVLDRVKKIATTGFAKGLKIVERYDPSLPPVLGDRDQLTQVLLNLVKNASEAIDKPGGEIQLTTAYRPGVRLSSAGSKDRVSLPLEICVIDEGAGVPADLLPHLFDPFVTTKPSGTGLGLALVAKIIGDHGGIIECDSQAGRTVFRILLPMQQGGGLSTERAERAERAERERA